MPLSVSVSLFPHGPYHPLNICHGCCKKISRHAVLKWVAMGLYASVLSHSSVRFNISNCSKSCSGFCLLINSEPVGFIFLSTEHHGGQTPLNIPPREQKEERWESLHPLTFWKWSFIIRQGMGSWTRVVTPCTFINCLSLLDTDMQAASFLLYIIFFCSHTDLQDPKRVSSEWAKSPEPGRKQHLQSGKCVWAGQFDWTQPTKQLHFYVGEGSFSY